MNPVELLINHKYAIGGVILFLIASYIYYKMRSGEDEPEDEPIVKKQEVALKPTPIAPQEFGDLQKLIRIFTHEMKKSSQSLIQFNTDKMKTHNYLNIRNNLFTKDIITTKLLVDSKSLNHSQEFDPSNFTVTLGGDSYPMTYKNVIGFRLLKCSVPVKPFHVVANHNVLTISTPSSSTTATIDVGSYTGKTLATELSTKLSAVVTPTVTVTYDSTELIFTFVSSGADVTIDWSQSPLLAKALGFYEAAKVFSTSGASSDYSGDFTTSFVDLVIPEIPAIACKDNSKGKPIIDRVPLIQRASDNSRSHYETNPSEYFTQNYFYPMKLGKLTIQLYLDSQDDIIYDAQKGETDFEFELTILKNTALMNS